MKQILTSLLLIAVTTTAFYLLGAFYAVSFNIAYWPDDTRAVVCFTMPMVWFACVMASMGMMP